MDTVSPLSLELSMDPLDIIYDHYRRGSRLADIVIQHSEQVRDKALEVAGRAAEFKPDLVFIAQASMLHDIGVCQTASPKIQCRGSQPYIRHGIIGREMLQQYGLYDHALVCERHVGAGISRKQIRQRQLPLPQRDMLPVTIEEKIICYADGFFSKTAIGKTHTLSEVKADHFRHGTGQFERFMCWHELFSGS